jgi:tetratricopeptide (TPR) repeat protein
MELRRGLAARNRDAFLPDLAMSLNNLSNMQSEVGQREAALATAQEGVELLRELVGRNRDAFLPDLASALNNLANRQSAVGQREALATAQEAVEEYRELMKRHRDAFVQNFATSCWTLANILCDVGKPAEGQSTYAQAIREVLPEVNKLPAVYVGFAVTLLRNYLEKAKAAGLEPDAALLTEAMQTLEPYLQKEQE